jgi:ATP-binding protein involved in chromosome partitioning
MSNFPIFSICSGKGGVGKSTVCAELTKALALDGYKVGVIDADIYGPSMHLLLEGLGSEKPKIVDNRIIPAQLGNIKLVSSAFIAPGGAFIRAPKAIAILKSFFESVDWGDVDLLIVDFPPGTGDIPLTLFQEVKIDSAIIVTTPHTLSVEDTAKSCMQILQAGIPISGVVENMAFLDSEGGRLFPFGKGGAQELCDLLGLNSFGQIPLQTAGNLDLQMFFADILSKIKILINDSDSEKKCCK